MATATLPYDGASMGELLGNMLRGAPADPRGRQPTLPEPSGAALLQALRPSPDDRFASAQAFGEAVLVPSSLSPSA
jgi:hypothetical protein